MENNEKGKLYKKIRDDIRVELGKFVQGDFVGTEVSFAEKYNVSRPTIRKAVELLIEEGVLERKAGIGLVIPSAQKHPNKHKDSILIIANIQKRDINLFSKSILGIIDYANSLNYSYQIINHSDKVLRNDILRRLNLDLFAGAVLTAYNDIYDTEMLDLLNANNIPFVLIDNPLEKGIYNYVVADDYIGGYMIGDYLGQLGHKKIMFLSTTNMAKTLENRLQGIKDGLEKHKVFLAPNDIIWLSFEAEAEPYIAGRAVSGNFNYTAIACGNDITALFAYNALNALGINIPGQVSITGFDGSIGEVLTPIKFTTVKIPGYDMGHEAARILFESLLNNSAHTKKIILDVSLEIGNSTAPVSP
ncbi:MAG: LacI family DNA-binding transcriptional regulator [Clostridia bacterium]|nr:LacI family DNA-binding transcriptional regulator [Clostridia bacterium]